ncbi:MAG: hypothetical protein SFY80_10180 [Verrucomicrobiota bacterium]|nr:hypothetical protein [Verrucomicrobiota bacterium]
MLHLLAQSLFSSAEDAILYTGLLIGFGLGFGIALILVNIIDHCVIRQKNKDLNS